MSNRSNIAKHLLSSEARRRLEDAEIQAKKEEEYARLAAGYGGQPVNNKDRVRHRHRDEDEHLEADDDDEPTSSNACKKEEAADDSDDPLDAFMAGVEQQAKKDKQVSENKAKNKFVEEDEHKDKKMLGRTDIDGEEAEDMQESYFRFLEENKERFQEKDEEEEDNIEYDADGNAIYSWKKIIDPLPPIDHSTVRYSPFNKNFYKIHYDIANLNIAAQNKLRAKMDLNVGGYNVPAPVCSFAHFNFGEGLMTLIAKYEFEHPTPIQAQAIPALLLGRDVIGIAKTGSGKTCAYLWPALKHLMDQEHLKQGDGPICLIMVPTRELAIQVYNECRKYGRIYNIRTVCAYGGGSKYEQQKALEEGAEIVVATPGRLIDLIKIGATSLARVTFLIFDEADRMFDLGFEAQVRSISTHVRPDRQCALFSATFKTKVEQLARDCLIDPVRIVQGAVGEANIDVAQEVSVLKDEGAKFTWLMFNLVNYCSTGKVLIFVTRKDDSVRLVEQLKRKNFVPLLLHGDMFQDERNTVLGKFRKDPAQVLLVATDVAARGLDIPEIRTVINYDAARDIDTHVHRIGRTGRAGVRGYAFTLLTEKDKDFAGQLVRSLEAVNQPVTNKLIDLAMTSEKFIKSRGAIEISRRPNIGGRGLGYKEKPADATDTQRVLHFKTAPNKAVSVKPSSGNASGSTSSAGVLGGTGKLNALKQAYLAGYANKFQRAEDRSMEASSIKRRKTRWGE